MSDSDDFDDFEEEIDEQGTHDGASRVSFEEFEDYDCDSSSEGEGYGDESHIPHSSYDSNPHEMEGSHDDIYGSIASMSTNDLVDDTTISSLHNLPTTSRFTTTSAKLGDSSDLDGLQCYVVGERDISSNNNSAADELEGLQSYTVAGDDTSDNDLIDDANESPPQEDDDDLTLDGLQSYTVGADYNSSSDISASKSEAKQGYYLNQTDSDEEPEFDMKKTMTLPLEPFIPVELDQYSSSLKETDSNPIAGIDFSKLASAFGEKAEQHAMPMSYSTMFPPPTKEKTTPRDIIKEGSVYKKSITPLTSPKQHQQLSDSITSLHHKSALSGIAMNPNSTLSSVHQQVLTESKPAEPIPNPTPVPVMPKPFEKEQRHISLNPQIPPETPEQNQPRQISFPPPNPQYPPHQDQQQTQSRSNALHGIDDTPRYNHQTNNDRLPYPDEPIYAPYPPPSQHYNDCQYSEPYATHRYRNCAVSASLETEKATYSHPARFTQDHFELRPNYRSLGHLPPPKTRKLQHVSDFEPRPEDQDFHQYYAHHQKRKLMAENDYQDNDGSERVFKRIFHSSVTKGYEYLRDEALLNLIIKLYENNELLKEGTSTTSSRQNRRRYEEERYPSVSSSYHYHSGGRDLFSSSTAGAQYSTYTRERNYDYNVRNSSRDRIPDFLQFNPELHPDCQTLSSLVMENVLKLSHSLTTKDRQCVLFPLLLDLCEVLAQSALALDESLSENNGSPIIEYNGPTSITRSSIYTIHQKLVCCFPLKMLQKPHSFKLEYWVTAEHTNVLVVVCCKLLRIGSSSVGTSTVIPQPLYTYTPIVRNRRRDDRISFNRRREETVSIVDDEVIEDLIVRIDLEIRSMNAKTQPSLSQVSEKEVWNVLQQTLNDMLKDQIIQDNIVKRVTSKLAKKL